MSQPATACSACGNTKFWRGKLAGSSWFCVACQPVPVPSMMGEVVDVTMLVESVSRQPAKPLRFKRAEAYTRCYIDAERGRCERCNGQLVQDTVREGGSWDVRCWTCKMIKASGSKQVVND